MSGKVVRRFLEEPDVNEIAKRRALEGDSDVFDLIFTIRKMRREPTNATMRTIVLGLQDAIHAHGAITSEWVSSAAKRVYGRMRGVRV